MTADHDGFEKIRLIAGATEDAGFRGAGDVEETAGHTGAVTAGGVVSAAADAGPLAAGGVRFAPSDGRVRSGCSVLIAACYARRNIADRVHFSSNKTAERSLGKPIKAPDDQVVRPAAVARIEWQAR